MVDNIEVEHPEGQINDLTKEQKHEIKKSYLRDAFGHETFEKLLKEAKDFLTVEEKARRKKYGLEELKTEVKHDNVE